MLRVEIFWGTEYSSTSSSVEKSFPFKLAKKFLCYLTLSSTNLLYPASGDVTTFLMTEARQQNTEIRMAISKVVDKIDNLASKVWSISCLLFLCFFFFFLLWAPAIFSCPCPSVQVDGLQKESSTGASHLLPGISSITMESAMIMNNIQRIIKVTKLASSGTINQGCCYKSVRNHRTPYNLPTQ